MHIAHSNALLQAGGINYPAPFSGEGMGGLVSRLELGFHLPFAAFYRIGGMSWIDIVRYFPSIMFAVTALSVYSLARREGFGWEAAFVACLIPTTIGLLGPAFFVPVALGLVFVVLSLFLVFNFRTFWSYVVLFIFITFLVIMHAPSAVWLLVILAPCTLLYLKTDLKHGLTLLIVWAVPFLITLPWTFDVIFPAAESLLVQKPPPAHTDLPVITRIYGYIPLGLGLLGTFWLAVKGGVKNYCMICSLLILLSILAVFFTLHYGDPGMYVRGILYMLLMLSIVAGAGLAVIKNLELSVKTGLPRILHKIGYLLCVVLIVTVLIIGIPVREDINYYHMIDEEDYQAFIWIRDNIDETYQMAILDPWKATAFTALTEKYVYSRTHVSPTPRDVKVRDFLRLGCEDTEFLRKNGISIVYTRESVNNSDLEEVRNNIYLVK